MIIKRPNDIKPSEITAESIYLNRRQFLRAAGFAALGAAAAVCGPTGAAPERSLAAVTEQKNTPFRTH